MALFMGVVLYCDVCACITFFVQVKLLEGDIQE